MSTQHEKALQALAHLGGKVFGLLVSHRGFTMTLLHEGSAREWWYAMADADDGGDGTQVEGQGETIEVALDMCADAVAKVECPDGKADVEQDDAWEDAWFEQRNTPR